MTTDITELAQRVKTEASAIDDTQWYLAKPSEIRSLVEALEKAQQYIKERDEENESLMLTVGRLRVEREALESRTVNVKLPTTIEPTAFSPWVAKAFCQFHKDTVKSCFAVFSDACAAAGIKVEAE